MTPKPTTNESHRGVEPQAGNRRRPKRRREARRRHHGTAEREHKRGQAVAGPEQRQRHHERLPDGEEPQIRPRDEPAHGASVPPRPERMGSDPVLMHGPQQTHTTPSTPGTRSRATSAITQPPNPPPVRRAPYAPRPSSRSTSASSSGVETAKSSRRLLVALGEDRRPHPRGRRRGARAPCDAPARSRRRRAARPGRRRPARASHPEATARRSAPAAASHAARRSA